MIDPEAMMMDRAALTASTPATRADAWTTAEHTALASASQLENDARIAREQAGELVGRPDMSGAAQRLSEEATAADHDAQQRRGLAQGYAAIRALQGGEPVATSGVVAVPTSNAVVAEDGDDEFKDDEPMEPEVFTHCYECDEPLDAPTTDEAKSVHPDCDPETPPQYWMGNLAANGKSINPDEAESYRRLKDVAADALDTVLEWEVPTGEVFISFPDGSLVDARTWIEQPENLELAGGLDQYAGRAEFDPAKPEQCWMGQTLPSGRIARPCVRRFDTVTELAEDVCRDAFTPGRDRFDPPYTVMLPGGELVDAHDWAHRPDTRRLAGYQPVQPDPDAPQRCWIGPTPTDESEPAPVEKLATPYDDVTALAAEVCRKAYETADRSRDRLSARSAPLTIMLPGGELVDAYQWSQQPDTQRLAGYTPVEFDPAAPQRCWVGRDTGLGAPVHQLATQYHDVATLAASVCAMIFEDDRIDSRTPHTAMLPGGGLVNAYDWAQQPDTRRLAGCTTVRNRVQFEATAHCKSCDRTTTCEGERTMQGEIGEQRVADGVLSCDGCGDYISIKPVPLTLVDDASAATDQPPRRI